MEWIYKNEETIEKLKDKTVYEHTHNEITHYINEHSDEINIEKKQKKFLNILNHFTNENDNIYITEQYIRAITM